jgi:hypothetical protein
MPQDKDLKRQGRRRMAETGERYTTARAGLEGGTVAGGDRPADHPAASTAEQPRFGSLDELLNYATLGLRADHLRQYRTVLPQATLEDLAGLWVMGITPERARDYAAAGLTRMQMLVAATAKVSPEEAADFAALATNARRATSRSDDDERKALTASRLEQLPVDDAFSEEQLALLHTLDPDVGAILRLPVDGPFSPDQILELARCDLTAFAEAIHAAPVDGPFGPGEVVTLSRLPLNALEEAAARAHEGPFSPAEFVGEALSAVDDES